VAGGKGFAMPGFYILLPPRLRGGLGWGLRKNPPLIPPQAGGDKILLRGIEDSAPATQIKIRNELFG
jgi:hypothetical protein